ncbi:MAG: hypothetical protein LBJ47_09720 [Tannerella sp.]|jgi:hypothetical protein|nr:hypothetical protein [Tannerella sp.]
MNRIKEFIFRKRPNDLPVIFITLGSLGWLPPAAGQLVEKAYFSAFAILYVSLSILLCLITGKIVTSERVRISLPKRFFCPLLILLLNGVMLYRYSFKILVTMDSFLITIPAGLLVALICAIWIKSKKVETR